MQPLYLLGWSMGGVIAQEMARQLEAAGITPAGVTMIDSWQSADSQTINRLEGYSLLHNFVRDLLGSAPMPEAFAAIETLDASRQPEAALAVLRDNGVTGGHLSVQEFVTLLLEYQANYNALVRHAPQPISTPTRLYRATRSQHFPLLAGFTVPDGSYLKPIAMDEDHFSIFQGEALRAIVAQSLLPASAADDCLVS
jgi:thioesterase domain-containing protein